MIFFDGVFRFEMEDSMFVFATVLGCAAAAHTLSLPTANVRCDDGRATFQKLDVRDKSSAIDFNTVASNSNSRHSLANAQFYSESPSPNLSRLELAVSEGVYLAISDGTIFTIFNRRTQNTPPHSCELIRS